MHTCVAIGILKKDDRVLFLKRERGNFPGLLALPGGKLEEGEGVYEAAVREIEEETGIITKVKRFLGTAAEIIYEGEKTLSTILFFCELEQIGVNGKIEETYHWLPIECLQNNPDIVFSDLLFLKHFYLDKDKNYIKVKCIHQDDGTYVWEKDEI